MTTHQAFLGIATASAQFVAPAEEAWRTGRLSRAS